MTVLLDFGSVEVARGSEFGGNWIEEERIGVVPSWDLEQC